MRPIPALNPPPLAGPMEWVAVIAVTLIFVLLIRFMLEWVGTKWGPKGGPK